MFLVPCECKDYIFKRFVRNDSSDKQKIDIVVVIFFQYFFVFRLFIILKRNQDRNRVDWAGISRLNQVGFVKLGDRPAKDRQVLKGLHLIHSLFAVFFGRGIIALKKKGRRYIMILENNITAVARQIHSAGSGHVVQLNIPISKFADIRYLMRSFWRESGVNILCVNIRLISRFTQNSFNCPAIVSYCVAIKESRNDLHNSHSFLSSCICFCNFST